MGQQHNRRTATVNEAGGGPMIAAGRVHTL